MKRFFGMETASAKPTALKVAGVYGTIALLWILLSDKVLLWLYKDPVQLTLMDSLHEILFVVASAGLLGWLVHHYVAALRREDEKLRDIAQGISVATGEAFWASLVRSLAGSLDIDYVSICELVGDQNERLRSLAVHSRRGNLDNFEMPWAATPEEKVLRQRGLYRCPENVRQLFPQASRMERMGAESFMGTPLIDSQGHAFGIIIIADSKPLYQAEAAENILMLFAVRAAVELERKRNDEALRESEERFRATFEQAAVGIAHLAPDGRWLRINQRYCDILGYSHDELEQLTFQELTHPDYLEAELVYTRKMLAGEIDSHSQEKPYIRKDGSQIWASMTVSMVREASGEPKYFIAVVEDIDDRKQAEQALRESEAQLARTEKFSLVMVAHVGLDGRWLKVSPTLCELLGYSEAELLAGQFQEITHPDDLDKDLSQCQRLLKGECKSFAMEKRYIRKDGAIVWVYLNCSVVLDRDDRPIHFVSYIHDITEQKRMEAELRAGEKKYRRLVENVRHGYFFYSLGRDGNLTYLSPSVTEVLGYRRDEALQHFHEYYTDSPLNREAGRPRGRESAHEVEVLDKNGRVHRLEMAEFPVFDAEGKLTGIDGMAHDITASRARH